MCKCCKEIEFWQKSKKKEAEEGIVESKIFAKLSIYSWKKGERKIKGNQISTITTKAHDLHYCPKCGKRLI